jgi:hypothetical protein
MAAYRICDGSRSGASQYTLIAITFSRISVQLSIYSVKIASQAEEGNLVRTVGRDTATSYKIIACPARKVWMTSAAGDSTVMFAFRSTSRLPHLSSIPIS